MEGTPLDDFDVVPTLLVEAKGKIEHPTPNPHHFSNDHLQLIFDMR
jgi:hypothetical protein